VLPRRLGSQFALLLVLLVVLLLHCRRVLLVTWRYAAGWGSCNGC
jgi:hypothetical protein